MSVSKKLLALSLISVLALGAGSALAAKSSSEVAAVHAADDAWVKAYNAGQLDNVVALYDEDAVVYPPGATPARGRAEIQAFFTKDIAGFATTGLVMTLGENPDGSVSGALGWSSGTWAAKDKSGNVVDSGWYFSVSKKVGGKWKYVRDTWNSDKPAAPAAAEK